MFSTQSLLTKEEIKIDPKILQHRASCIAEKYWHLSQRYESISIKLFLIEFISRFYLLGVYVKQNLILSDLII